MGDTIHRGLKTALPFCIGGILPLPLTFTASVMLEPVSVWVCWPQLVAFVLLLVCLWSRRTTARNRRKA